MKIVFKDYLDNEYAAMVLDTWYNKMDYEVYQFYGEFYRLDRQQLDDPMWHFTLEELVIDLIERLESRQTVHVLEDIRQSEYQEIQILKTYLDILRNED